MSMIGNMIYIFGGFYHNRFSNTIYAIDLEQSEVHTFMHKFNNFYFSIIFIFSYIHIFIIFINNKIIFS
jgi:hypothetical protein